MKITKDTRINAFLLQQKSKDVILWTKDQNMTVVEYLEKTIPSFLLDVQVPNPFVIFELDYQIVDIYKDENGDTFTLLFHKTDELTSSIVKLDLA